jgi:RNA-directed DNA polymerase
LHDLAEFWNVGPSQLGYYAYRIDKTRAYSTFDVPRRNGGTRRIEAPIRTLKFIQRLLHESLSRLYGPHPAVHGFLADRSIVTNAKCHLGRRYVLNIDLADFFPSITRKRIYGRLVAEPYGLDKKVANLIAALSTNRYARLPQGSPSSPVIANMVTAQLDADLAELCGQLRCRYTRYADDMTISTARGEMSPDLARYPNAQGTGQVIIGDRLTAAIERNGFRINHRKSRLYSHSTRQICTGLVVNGENPSPHREYMRHLRSLVDHWRRNGWRDAAQVLHEKENRRLLEDRQKLVNHVNGRINFVKMVRGEHDQICDRLERIIASFPEDH